MLKRSTGYYWIVEQILAKGLHQADDDSKSYTMNLMDKLELVSLKSYELTSSQAHLHPDEIRLFRK